MKGQVGIEYSTIILFGLFILSTFYASYLFITESGKVYLQTKRSFLEFAEEVEKMCYESPGAESRIFLFIPAEVDRTLNFTNLIGFRALKTDFWIVPPCNVTMIGEFHRGGNIVKIRNVNGSLEVIIS